MIPGREILCHADFPHLRSDEYRLQLYILPLPTEEGVGKAH